MEQEKQERELRDKLAEEIRRRIALQERLQKREAELEQQDERDSGRIDILVLLEGTEASERIVSALAQPLINQEIRSIDAGSELGGLILDQMPPDVSVPFHAVEENGRYILGDLSDLVKRYA